MMAFFGIILYFIMGLGILEIGGYAAFIDRRLYFWIVVTLWPVYLLLSGIYVIKERIYELRYDWFGL